VIVLSANNLSNLITSVSLTQTVGIQSVSLSTNFTLPLPQLKREEDRSEKSVSFAESMTEVFERSASSSSESDTYSSDESDSYSDTDSEEEDERSVEHERSLEIKDERSAEKPSILTDSDDSMVVKSGVGEVPITQTETK
jgi:hypothetical protein